MRHPLLLLVVAFALAGCGGPEERLADYIETGIEEFDNGNFEKARVNFANALQIDPANVNARFWSGRTAEELERWTNAINTYTYVLDLDPNHTEAGLRLARLYAVSSQPQLALGVVEDVLALDPGNLDAIAIRGVTRVRGGDLTNGVIDLRRAVAEDPANRFAVPALASVLSRAGSDGEALTVLRNARAADPEFVEASVLVAEILTRVGLMSEAEQEVEELVRAFPDTYEYQAILARVYAQSERPDRVEQTLREAMANFPERLDAKLALVSFIADQSVDAAIDEIDQLQERFPDFAELHFAEADLWKRQDNVEKAEEIYRTIVEEHARLQPAERATVAIAELKLSRGDVDAADELLRPVLLNNATNADALLLRSTVHMARSEPDMAIVDLRTVLRDRQDDPNVYRLLAQAHLAMDEVQAAREQMRRAIEVDRSQIQSYIELAGFEQRLGNLDAAREALRDALGINAADRTANDMLFRIELAAEDWEQALAQARRIQAEQPESATGYLYEGLLTQRQGDEERAESLYRKSLELSPRAVEPLSALVSLMLSNGRADEAGDYVDSLLERHDNFAFGWNIRGEIALSQEQFEASRGYFERAIEQTPGWWQPYRGLTWSHLQKGEVEDAYTVFERAEKAVPSTEYLVREVSGAFESLGRADLAINMVEVLVQSKPDSPAATNHLAALLATYGENQNSRERALALAEPLVATGTGEYLGTYGLTLLKNGKIDAAQDALTRAADAGAPRGVLAYYRALLEVERGNEETALALFEEALAEDRRFVGYPLARAQHDRLAARL